MRVLLATDFYPPFVGGTERQVEILAGELSARGHEVHVATVWHRGLPYEEKYGGILVHRLEALTTRLSFLSRDLGRRFHPPFPEAAIVGKLRQLVRNYQIDVVHAFGWIAYSCAVAVIKSGASLVVSAQDYGYSCPTRTLLFFNSSLCTGPSMRKCFACASMTYGCVKALAAVIGVHYGRYLLRRHTIHALSGIVATVVRRDLLTARDAAQVVILPPTVISRRDLSTTDNPEEVNAHVSGLPSRPYILFIGALRRFKGIYELLEAYGKLVAPPPLVLVGSTWPESPTDFPDNVILVRNAPRSVVMKICESALFSVSPSIYPEPFGGVVLEAMAKGKPVIGSIGSGHEDMIINGVNGFLIDPTDINQLLGVMQRLVDDTQLREQFGRSAQERAASFVNEALVPRFEALYTSTIDRDKASK